MNQQYCTAETQTRVQGWSSSTIQEQIRGIEALMTSSSWLYLSPLQKQNWRRQLNGLRCQHIFLNAYPNQTDGHLSSNVVVNSTAF